jgi:hypothetical protein
MGSTDAESSWEGSGDRGHTISVHRLHILTPENIELKQVCELYGIATCRSLFYI